jgi:hypothetical protein
MFHIDRRQYIATDGAHIQMDSTIAWMIAGGARLNDQEPDPNHLAHLAALREANRQTAPTAARSGSRQPSASSRRVSPSIR